MSYVSGNLLEIVRQSGLKQHEFAAKMGVSVATQRNYEKGLRKPDTEYLRRLHIEGYDVVYLLTGQRNISALSHEDSELLRLWHDAPLLIRHAALNVLMTHQSPTTDNTKQSKFSDITQSDAGTQNIGDNNDNRQVNTKPNQQADKIQNNDFRKSKIKNLNQ